MERGQVASEMELDDEGLQDDTDAPGSFLAFLDSQLAEQEGMNAEDQEA